MSTNERDEALSPDERIGVTPQMREEGEMMARAMIEAKTPIDVGLIYAAMAAVRATGPAEAGPQTTHWDDCWREHLPCAVRKIQEMMGEGA